MAVLFLDLDGFKHVNDDLGHSAGDSVLVQVAQRMQAARRSGDVLGRRGGDEFVAVLTGLDRSSAAVIAERVAGAIAAALSPPIVVGAVHTQLSASVGIALFPEHASTTDGLLDTADAAMYRHKSRAEEGSNGRRRHRGAHRDDPGEDPPNTTPRQLVRVSFPIRHLAAVERSLATPTGTAESSVEGTS